jgi:carboxyl-terminal processing protease
MISKVKLLLLTIFLILHSIGFANNKVIDPVKEKKLLALIINILKKNHFSPATIDDEFSKSVFKAYINKIDPYREFLLDSDIDYFKKYETKIDDLIKANDLTFFYITYDRLTLRMKEFKENYSQLVKNPNDFFINDYLNIDSVDVQFANSKTDLKNNCRLNIKHFVLKQILEKQDHENDKKLKNNKYVSKDLATLEKESRELCLKKIDRSYSNIDNVDREYVFGNFLNSIISEFDSHSIYFDPEELLNINMKKNGKIEGVGINWGYNNNFIEVRSLIVDSPAWKDNKLEAGDILLKVAEGNEEPIDVVGYSLYDHSKISKGKKKGSIVKYTVRKQDESVIVVSLKREIFDYQDAYVKTSIVEINNKKFGLIKIPKFYKDFENPEGKDVTKDVSVELEMLKKSNIKGIVIDIRNNTLGALDAVIETAGLFLGKVPIVQVKSSNQKIELFSNNLTNIVWDGPMIVLTNNQTSSVSEIFAAVIQDYNRGIIIGGNNTYGYGTIQEIIDLNQYNSNKSKNSDDGGLKITEKKYYRLNGESTQIKGVLSDIKMPNEYIFSKNSEKNLKKTLSWDKINAVEIKLVNDKNSFEKIISSSENRIVKNQIFKQIEKYSQYLSNLETENNINLNLEKFDVNRMKKQNDLEKFKEIGTYKNKLNFKSVLEDKTISKKEKSKSKDKTSIWLENLSKDIYIEESVNVLSDILK